jgi:hypothetical protein
MCERTIGCRRSERGDGDAEGGREDRAVGIDADGRADLRRTGVRVRDETPGGPRAAATTCHGGCRRATRIEEELSCREALDEAHGAATPRTRP